MKAKTPKGILTARITSMGFSRNNLVLWYLEIITEGKYQGMRVTKFSNFQSEYDSGFAQLHEELNRLGIELSSTEDIRNVIKILPGREVEILANKRKSFQTILVNGYANSKYFELI